MTAFACVVCDKRFEREVLRGRYVQRYKLCDSCVESHKWCSWRAHAPLRSAFSTSTHRSDGRQTLCNDCLVDKRGSNRILECGNCRDEFRPHHQNKHRFNGTSVNLCDDCYPLVKHCNKCGSIKPKDEFAARNDNAVGRKAHCRACDKERWDTTAPAVKFRHRAAGRKFEITHDEWLAMRAAQDDLCAICGQPETAKRGDVTIPLSIDHCHASGKIRSLLCGRCNTAIGQMLDDPVRLRAAADYVERWAAALAESSESVTGQ